MTNIYGFNDKLSLVFSITGEFGQMECFLLLSLQSFFVDFLKKTHIKNDLTIGKIFRNFQRIPLRI